MSANVNNSRGGEYATSPRGKIAENYEFIRAKAAAGVPIQHIARMVGCSTLDVQNLVALPTLGATPKPPPVDTASRATLKAIRNRPSHKNLPRTEQWRQVRTARAITMPPRALAVVKAVAHRHGVELDALLGGRVIGGIVRARQEAMHALFMLGTFSTTQIGGFIGGRDHTSAIHGIRAHRERIQPDLDAWSTLGKSEAA